MSAGSIRARAQAEVARMDPVEKDRIARAVLELVGRLAATRAGRCPTCGRHAPTPRSAA